MKWSRQLLRSFWKVLLDKVILKCTWNFVVCFFSLSRDFVQEVARMESPVLEHVVWPFFCADVEGYGLDATILDCSCQRRLFRLIDEFVEPPQSKCIRLTRTRLHLFHRVLTGQVTMAVIESTGDSHNISRDSSKKWREWNQLCWNTSCDLFLRRGMRLACNRLVSLASVSTLHSRSIN